jgi:hypothetical protein
VLRKSRYDLGKKFFTNITPGYQLYPAVFLMPWSDPNAPGEFVYLCRGTSGWSNLRASNAACIGMGHWQGMLATRCNLSSCCNAVFNGSMVTSSCLA